MRSALQCRAFRVLMSRNETGEEKTSSSARNDTHLLLLLGHALDAAERRVVGERLGRHEVGDAHASPFLTNSRVLLEHLARAAVHLLILCVISANLHAMCAVGQSSTGAQPGEIGSGGSC